MFFFSFWFLFLIAIPLEEVFGIGGYHTWFLPIDPVFEDFDHTMGYSTPQRLAREQRLMDLKRPNNKGGDIEMLPC